MPDLKQGFFARIAGIVVNYIKSKLFTPTTQEPSTQTDAKQVSEKKALLPQPAPPISPELQKKIDALERVSSRTALSFQAAQDEINKDALSAKSTPRASPRGPEKTLTSTTSAKQPNTEKLLKGRVQLNPTDTRTPRKTQIAPDTYWNCREPSTIATIYSAVSNSLIGGYNYGKTLKEKISGRGNLSSRERFHNIINPWDHIVDPTYGKAEPKPLEPLSREAFQNQTKRTHIHHSVSSPEIKASEPVLQSLRAQQRTEAREAKALSSALASRGQTYHDPNKRERLNAAQKRLALDLKNYRKSAEHGHLPGAGEGPGRGH